MKFRPCIDLHGGHVKQLVGKTLADNLQENFVSEQDAKYYADMFRRDELNGGHLIMLGSGNVEQALGALLSFPGGMQIGGGINCENAEFFLENGASHVIITSALFEGDKFSKEKLLAIMNLVGKERLVVDLSCVRNERGYFAAKDGWRTTTDFEVTANSLHELSKYCSEFLIHSIDVEGQMVGPDYALVELLTAFRTHGSTPITYAGGISKYEDIIAFESACLGLLDFTVGSALDIYGGDLPYSLLAKSFR